MDRKEIVTTLAVTAAGIATETTSLVFGTVQGIHRGPKSHNSLEADPRFANAVNIWMTPFTDPSEWGATHIEGHHKLADANVQPFVEIADYMDWREAHDDHGHPPVPDVFDNLDYVARGIKLDTARQIGATARLLIAGKYEPREHYTPEQAARILDTQTPRYTYQNLQDRRGLQTPSEWSDDKIVRVEDLWWRLMDPHSPSLHPDGPRFKSFARDMIRYMYSPTARMYDSNEQLPDYAHRNKKEQWRYDHRRLTMRSLITTHILGGAGLGALLGERKPHQIAKNAAAGGAVVGLAGVGLVAGGTLTNYFGHLGAEPRQAFRAGIITPHPDGSLATNGETLFSWATMDEAGWQGNHHNHPDWIDFGDGRPFRAPVGFILKKLAEKELLGFKLGKGFGTDHRPDELDPSVVMLQKERVRTMEHASRQAA